MESSNPTRRRFIKKTSVLVVASASMFSGLAMAADEDNPCKSNAEGVSGQPIMQTSPCCQVSEGSSQQGWHVCYSKSGQSGVVVGYCKNDRREGGNTTKPKSSCA